MFSRKDRQRGWTTTELSGYIIFASFTFINRVLHMLLLFILSMVRESIWFTWLCNVFLVRPWLLSSIFASNIFLQIIYSFILSTCPNHLIVLFNTSYVSLALFPDLEILNTVIHGFARTSLNGVFSKAFIKNMTKLICKSFKQQ